MDIGGKKIPTWAIIGGGAGLVLVIYLYKRGASSGSSSGQIDPLTGLPASQDNQTDPLTGLTYLAEAQQYGSVSAAEAAYAGGAGGPSYLTSGGNPGTGYVGTAGYPSSVTPLQQVTSFGTNAQWAQAAEAYLISLGYDAATVTNALGAYITGSKVTSDQAVVVNAAIGAEGYPPVQGTSGNPPGINLGTPAPAPTPTPTPAPAPTPTPTTQVHKYPAPTGLKVVSKTSSSVTITWNNTSPPAASSTVALYQMNGKNVYYQTTSIPDTTGGRGQVTVGGLHTKWEYQIHVWQNGGAVAPPHASITVTLP